MIRAECWPPPDWVEVTVAWGVIIEGNISPHVYYTWCDQHPSTGRYHVHGWASNKGFAFRFEQPRDATIFTLIWS